MLSYCYVIPHCFLCVRCGVCRIHIGTYRYNTGIVYACKMTAVTLQKANIIPLNIELTFLTISQLVDI
nr:MAG TPA: 4Fe-4S binding domain protein [Caudoviricetes sp.]